MPTGCLLWGFVSLCIVIVQQKKNTCLYESIYFLVVHNNIFKGFVVTCNAIKQLQTYLMNVT